MTPYEAYTKAGSVAARVRETSKNLVRQGALIIDICEELESSIRKLGAQPAFPCNVSQNSEAAHYTAGIGDGRKIEAGAIVKIDVGAHVEGYIADTATTVSLSHEFDRMTIVNKQLLEDAVKTIRGGVSISVVANAVEPAAHRNGFKPISNLAGHELGNYIIHAGVSVPNVSEPVNESFKYDTAYAVEPFLVPHEADGSVVNGPGGNIYRLVSRKRTKNQGLDQIVEFIWNKFKSLPFSPRWLIQEFGERTVTNGMSELSKLKLVMQYPRLVESSGAMVSQFEHTIYVSKESTRVTTAFP
ncbi:MAG: type II methionyl aminopeptidase [Nitrososphaerota archaeon]|jgi:methionyl aminopeptidase|nr:type II methionyl aminopeptidase [Nitrososphaerota archaeon]